MKVMYWKSHHDDDEDEMLERMTEIEMKNLRSSERDQFQLLNNERKRRRG